MSMVVMTELETADFMHCKPSKIARLRRAGLLRYIPGKPVLIDKADVDTYLESVKRKSGKPISAGVDGLPKIETAEDARAWAMKAHSLQRLGLRNSP